MFATRLRSAAALMQRGAMASELAPLYSLKDFAMTAERHPFRQSNQNGCDLSRYYSTSKPETQHYEKHVLYRGKGIQLFRILVRLKIFQLSGIAALAIPISAYINAGEVSHLQTVIASSLVIGSGVASTAMWYYSRRYIGELSLLVANPNTISDNTQLKPNKIRLSVLDFWGNREDIEADVEDIVPPLLGLPPAVAKATASEPILPLQVTGDRQYILSLRYGHVLDGPKLQALLTGGDSKVESDIQQQQNDES